MTKIFSLKDRYTKDELVELKIEGESIYVDKMLFKIIKTVADQA